MTTRFGGHLLSGAHSARPSATTTPAGTVYACSDHNLIYQTNGSAWSTWATLGVALGGQFMVTFDGGGAALTADTQTDIIAPYSGTITGWTMLADLSGSAVVDIWSDTYGNYPPTDADSITASAPPTLTTASKAASTTLTGWTTAVTAGNVLRFNLDSATTVTRLLLVVDYSRL